MAVGLLALAALWLWAIPATAAAKTIHIRGKAYAFNHAETHLAGATIRVRELPRRSAVTDADGDYDLRVPDGADVTPYIDPGPGYNEIDLQTFHTRGRNIRHANFQTPADAEYKGLAALLAALDGLELGPDGRPTQCVVVTTVSARNVRDVPFRTFVERTPHGVAGATASSFPSLPAPIYFNDAVYPDQSQTESSGDGGIVWSVVPAGTYRFVAEHPSTRFASFLATCEPGRVVNANPPWGMYELAAGEKPLGASIVAAEVARAKALRRDRRRLVLTRLEAGESVAVTAALRKLNRRIARVRLASIRPGSRKLRLRVRRAVGRGRATLRVKLTDAAGETAISKLRVRIPRRHRR